LPFFVSKRRKKEQAQEMDSWGKLLDAFEKLLEFLFDLSISYLVLWRFDLLITRKNFVWVFSLFEFEITTVDPENDRG
jgi:hypothetical protein